MARVFVSYSHVDPDRELAKALVEALRQKHEVFWDGDLKVGQRWPGVIEREVARAGFMVLLVSTTSIKSDFVRAEITLARRSNCAVLPVRVKFTEKTLPYDLEGYLGEIQYVTWEKEAETPRLAAQLLEALGLQDGVPRERVPVTAQELTNLFNATEGKGLPLPSADPRFVWDAGVVDLASPYYVERTSDAAAHQQLEAGQRTITVKGYRQSGKSSLLSRLARAARDAGNEVVFVDMQLFPEDWLKTTEGLCEGLIRATARDLKIDMPSSVQMNVHTCTGWFDSILANAKQAIFILIDEADLPRGNPGATAFYAMLRAWYQRFAQTGYRLILAHSIEPRLFITDVNQSPFNVGFQIALPEFTAADVVALNDRLKNPLAGEHVPALLELISGHPYLVRRALYEVKAGGYTMQLLKDRGALPHGPFGDHLKRLSFLVRQSPALHTAAQKLLRGKQPSNDETDALISSGLVRENDPGRFRCQIYRNYLESELAPQGFWERLFG